MKNRLWPMFMVLLGVIWLSHAKVLPWTGPYNTDQAIGFDIATIGMPLTLLCLSTARLRRKVEIAGASCAWRFALGWVACSFSLSLLYSVLTQPESQRLGAILLFLLSSGLSFYLFREAYKRAPSLGTESQHKASTRLSEAKVTSQSAWFKDVEKWIEDRFKDPSLKSINSIPYKQHLYHNVVRLRSMVLTDAELMSPLRGTASSLILSTQLYIVGADRNYDRSTILGAMSAVLADYPSFHAFKEINSDASIQLADIARMFLLEGEMFSVLYLFMSGDRDFFQNTLTSATELASNYWAQDEGLFSSPLALRQQKLQGWQGDSLGNATFQR